MGDLALFGGGQVPAHIRAAFGDTVNSDLTSGVTVGFPILSIKGKVWHLLQGGERNLIRNAEGEPKASLEVVILKSNPNISKVYYQGGYVEGSDERPTCYSHDGVAPGHDAQGRQAEKCAICPRNMWGSRVTDNGSKGKECADARRIAVAPAGDLNNAMLLRVPAASLKALKAYGEMLSKRGAPYQALVTRIGFDYNVAHPQLTFTPVRWLEAHEVETVAETAAGPVVEAIIGNEPVASEYVAAPSPLDSLPGTPPPSMVAAPSPAPAARGRKAAAVVSPKEVEAAIGGFGSDAPVASPPPPVAPQPVPAQAASPAPTRHDKLLLDANASLNEVLAALDD